MKINNIVIFVIIMGLTCSLTINGIFYGQINEQKTTNTYLTDELKVSQKYADKNLNECIAIQKSNDEKNRFIKQYFKANYYIISGGNSFITSDENFQNGHYHYAKEQIIHAIDCYNDYLNILNDVQNITTDEQIKSDIEIEKKYIKSVIRYFEADLKSVNLYILSSENFDDYTLSTRYYEKYLDAFDEETILYDECNKLSKEMLENAGISIK